MKCSESWLREWVNPTLSREELANTLTMAGLEVEAIIPVADIESLCELPAEVKTDGDHVIEISITPNRGDCLSVRGIAREISALTNTPLHEVAIAPVPAAIPDKIPVHVDAVAACPRYVARVIRGVKADAKTPLWLSERLRRSGVRSISPVVDVTNYVMLELGQPMHAFDLNTIDREIRVRLSTSGEHIALLDGTEKELDDQTLVIADKQKPLAIAGVMGGLDSSVTLLTTDILLESAYFSPQTVARQRQHYHLASDSSYRFERSIDATIQRQAIERATQLILTICGGAAGEVIEKVSKIHLPKANIVTLKKEKVSNVLGVQIPHNMIEDIFLRLGFTYKNSWKVTIPSYRPDIILPEDLIEEIARVYGYDNIPTHVLQAALRATVTDDNGPYLQWVRQVFVTEGFHEIISYSFVDKKLQALLNPMEVTQELVNPMTADMEVMRTNLWPGLITTFLYNKSRQQSRIRLFEIGTCFLISAGELTQQQKMSGLIAGTKQPEQWGVSTAPVDFYDLKNTVVNILSRNFKSNEIIFKSDTHPALHPGQTAAIYCKGDKIGIIGALHPTVLQQLDVTEKVFVFEMAIPKETGIRQSADISKFPEIRRDLALLVNETIPASKIQDTIKACAGDWLKDIFIFDVYQGKGITPGLKSVALALVLQHPTRTLIDSEVAEITERVVNTLKGQLGAELRS